jgi:hypothetical protein
VVRDTGPLVAPDDLELGVADHDFECYVAGCGGVRKIESLAWLGDESNSIYTFRLKSALFIPFVCEITGW